MIRAAASTQTLCRYGIDSRQSVIEQRWEKGTRNVLLVANSLAIVASIGGFILSLIHLRKGKPSSITKRKRQVYIFVGVSILSAVLLVFLSFRLKNDIETLEQKGSFEHYAQGVQEVFYPIPYQSPPCLTMAFSCGARSALGNISDADFIVRLEIMTMHIQSLDNLQECCKNRFMNFFGNIILQSFGLGSRRRTLSRTMAPSASA